MKLKEKPILSSKPCALALPLCLLTALIAMPPLARSASVPPQDAGAVTVSWTFATYAMDGTPLSDLAGAKVYYGTSSSNYTHVVDVPGGAPGETRSYNVTGLEPGVVYYLNGTAYSSGGLESDFCNEVVRIAAIDTDDLVTEVDNTQAEASAGWTTSMWAPGHFGTNYLHDNNQQKGSREVVFRPNLAGGRYNVYMWWPAERPSYRWAEAVPVDIVGSAGMVTVMINQREGGGEWVWVGNTTFDAGTTGYVRIRNSETSGYVIADAVRFTPADSPQQPIVSTWPTASSITQGQSLDEATLSGGSASLPGTFAFVTPSATPAVGTASHAARFTPTDIANYTTVDGTVSVTVNAVNQPPVVDAGPDRRVLAETPILMQGSLSDDGLPLDGQFEWTVITAAGDVKITNPDQPDASVTFQRWGTHTLRLTVSDGDLTGHDEVTFDVLPFSEPRGLRRIVNSQSGG